MFKNPIKHTTLTTMDQLLDFSYRTDYTTEKHLAYCQNNGQIAFSDESGQIWVTPYRSEIHNILANANYTKHSFSVPFSNNGDERPEAYKWLVQIANEENWAETYEKAFKIASEKGIKPVTLKNKVYVKQITSYFEEEDKLLYSEMVDKYLTGSSQTNIATYIIVNEKTLLLCDEYGRTFIVKVNSIINDVVNALIDAGYTRTTHPEFYIHKKSD